MRNTFETMHAIGIAVLFGATIALAQVPPTTNPLDGVTPHSLKPADPTNTYTLEKFEQLNYYNGTVSIQIPLLTIAGRGDLSYQLSVSIKPSVWSAETNYSNDNTVSQDGSFIRAFRSAATFEWWHPHDPGFGPGFVVIKRSVEGPRKCGTGQSSVYTRSFTHVAYISGGTEYELYDTVFPAYTSGLLNVSTGDCSVFPDTKPPGWTSTWGSRGSTFRDRSGAGLTFVASEPIADVYSAGDGVVDTTQPDMSVNGTLYFRNGSRASVDNGRIVKIVDRHGNKMTFCYRPCSAGVSGNETVVQEITDALGRTYRLQQATPSSPISTIKFRPNKDTEEQIISVYWALSDSEGVLKGSAATGSLFPELSYTGTTTPRFVPVKIVLPNATAASPSYQFRYNAYGELAEVKLPTGGKIEYDYGAGLDCNGQQGCYPTGQVLEAVDGTGVRWSSSPPERPLFAPFIYRRLLERREYVDGATLARTTKIARPEKARITYQHALQSSSASATVNKYDNITIAAKNYVEVQESGTGITGQVSRRHYFFPISDFAVAQNKGLFPKSAIDTPEGYETNDALWDTLGGAANELLLKANAASRIRGYPDAFQAKEYRTVTVGLEQRDFAYSVAANDAQVCHEIATRLDAIPSLLSGSVMYYDAGTGNQTDRYEFDFGSAPSLATVADVNASNYVRSSCPAQAALSGYLRHTKTTYLTGTEYVDTPTHLPSLVSQVEVSDASGGVASQTDFVYDEATPDEIANLKQFEAPIAGSKRGNATSVKRLVRDLWTEAGFTLANQTIQETRKYDKAGNLIEVKDPLLRVTKYSYTDKCAGTAPSGTLGAFLTGIEFPLSYHKTSWEWDCYLGRPTSFTDRDNTTTAFLYETPANKLNRLEKVTAPTGAITSFAYTDTPGSISVTATSDQYAPADGRKVSQTQFDGLGRLVRTTVTGDTQSVVTSEEYDALSRKWRTHGPRYSTDPDTYDEFAYDALDRLVSAKHLPGGDSATRTYAGNKVTIVDEALKKTVQTTDAFGRLKQVEEDPGPGTGTLGYITSYTYDLVDNLKTVTQAGAQQRTFEYDSLRRLRKASNGERGTTRYKYSSVGSLTERSEQDGTVVSLSYDSLNRLTGKTYTGTTSGYTPQATWCYDGSQFSTSTSACSAVTVASSSTGKVTEARTTDSSTTFKYDGYGRVNVSEQRTAPVAQAYAFAYEYYIDGSKSSQTLPSGRVITNCYDKLGHVVWVSGSKTTVNCAGNPAGPLSANDAYATGISYAGHGPMAQLQYGNGLFEKVSFNTRRQPSMLQLGNSAGSGDVWQQTIVYPTTGNNGNVQRIDLTVPGKSAVSTHYAYDGVNRLLRAVEGGANADTCNATSGVWCQQFGYDARGNMQVSAEFGLGATPWRPTGFNSQNRVSNADWAYGDNRGNVTAIAMVAGGAPDKYLYDAEDRLATYCQATNLACADKTVSSGRTVYRYDADGRRVKKESSSEATVFVYDAEGHLAAEYGGTPAVPGVQYLTVDQLGSTRVVTNGDKTVGARYDYEPFGRELMVSSGSWRFGVAGYGSAAGFSQRFTGKERDSETGLDYFGARYFSGAQGRFTTADPIIHPSQSQAGREVFLSEPQRWNKYAYVSNNPLKYVDPDGAEQVVGCWGGRCVNNGTGETLRPASNRDLALTAAVATAGVAGYFAPEIISGMAALGPAAVRVGEAFKSLLQDESGVLRISNPNALGQEITRLGDKVANNLKALDQQHISAATRELAGEVVKINERTGKGFDHVTEVRNAAQGLVNAAGRAKQLLGDPNLTQKARSALETTLRQANDKLKELRETGIIP